jgi:hypothetical protein
VNLIIYDLSHLRTYTTKFTRPAQSNKAAESYSVNISFSHHCFTQGLPAEDETYNATLRFDVDGDERIFNVRQLEAVQESTGYRRETSYAEVHANRAK